MMARSGGRTVFARLRRWFLTGVVALLPLAVAVLLVHWLLGLGGRLVGLLPHAWRPETVFGPWAPLVGVAIAVGFIVLVGAGTSYLLGARIMRVIDRVMERLPLVNTLHRATRQLLRAVLSEDAEAFQEVVLAPFPAQSTRVIGFVTGYVEAPEGGRLAGVFVPSTPVPSTGWLLFVKPEELTPLPISIDDAMKLVLSGGALLPEAWPERWR